MKGQLTPQLPGYPLAPLAFTCYDNDPVQSYSLWGRSGVVKGDFLDFEFLELVALRGKENTKIGGLGP
jgi:hypothetical protein